MLAADTKVVAQIHPAFEATDNGGAWRLMVEPVIPFLEEVSRRLSAQVEAFDPEVVPFARYALTSQGKQMRPALVALSSGVVGEWGDASVNVAVIIEMVHLATLVHDDVVDEARIRRSRPTLAANWGNEVSVLLGDCLFAHALKLAAEFPTTEVCRAVSSATNTVCSGEILQTLRRRKFLPNRAEYFKILEMKTAELFSLSCDLGAAMAGGGSKERSALREYGRHLGIAYQVLDDCVDIFGIESEAGKSLGTDLAGGKITLPVIVLLERATSTERKELQQLLQNWSEDSWEPVRRWLGHHHALVESKRVIHQMLLAARQALSALKPSAGRNALVAFTDYIAQQTEALGVGSS